MKTNTIVVAAFVAVCTLTACSTGTDALENSVPIEGTMLTPEQLSQELIAKMEASPWIDQTRKMTVAFGCAEEATTYLTFEFIEHTHKVLARDGNFYFVVGSVLPGEDPVTDIDGNVFDVEFALDMPAPRDDNSGSLYQRLTISIVGNGYLQVFEADLLVESNIIPVIKGEDISEEDLLKAETGLARLIPGTIEGSCVGTF